MSLISFVGLRGAASIVFAIMTLNNALNLAVDLGERGSLKDNMVRERYVQFIINVNIHDLWFIKPKYD